MKILSIRIKNLASLSGEHFIDFESEPLASAGLVAIVGKTGAGKSTILDAMCLALFNKIPRLKKSDGKLLDNDGTELAIDSPLTVLRRGTSSGFAELCFLGNDQKKYIAFWEARRARDKITGKLKINRNIQCITDNLILADKTTHVDESIYKITQLSFEQFTRAVLLAQSEVTAFLKARDNERGELLEYLTNSSIFGKIGQLAFERTKSVVIKRKELENLLGHIEILSDEKVAELNTQFQTIDQAYQKLDAEKSQLEKQQQWFEHQHKLDNEIILKQQHVDDQLKAQHALAPEQIRLDRLQIFSGIRSTVFQQQQFLKIEQELAPQIQQQQQSFNQLQAQFELQKAEFIQAETALNEQQNFESVHFESINQVRHCNTERDRIGAEFKKTQSKLSDLQSTQQPLVDQQKNLALRMQVISQQYTQLNQNLVTTQQFTCLDKGLNAHIQQLGQFIQHYQKIENQLGNLTQAQQQLSAQKNQLSQAIEQFGNIEQLEQDIEQARQQREQKLQQRNQLDFIQQKLTDFFERQTDAQGLNEQLKTITTQLQSAEKVTLQAEQDFQTAKTERQKLHEILQQQRLLHAENIEHLRAELQDGEPCLVCGSTSHPYKVDDAAVSKALFELQQQQEQQAMVKEQESLKIWQNAQHASTKLKTELEQLNLSIQNNADKLSSTQNALMEYVQAIHLKLDLTQSQTEMSTQFKQYTQQYQTDIQQIETQSDLWIQSMKQQRQLEQEIKNAESLITNAMQYQEHVQYIVDTLSELEKSTWQQHTVATAQQVFNQLNQRFKDLEQAEKLLKDADQLNQQQQTLTLNIGHISKQVADTQNALNDIKVKGQQNTETATQLIQHMTGLTDVKPHEWLVQHDTQRQHIQNHHQQLKHNFEQLRTQFEYEKGQLQQRMAQQQQNQQQLTQVNVEIENWLITHSDFQQQDLTELAQVSTTQEQQLRQQLQEAERLLNDANTILKTFQAQRAEHLAHQPEIDFAQLQQWIADNIAALKAQSEIRDAIKIDLAKHDSNVQKQKQYANQITEIQQEEHRWGKISGLMGDATGKKFRDYAQQYNLDILLEHANQQLTMLSQRYTLKRLDNSLSLAIIDHDMDGETRSVASLSGGESFLTALALSLAIANMASGSMKIESLFIDEGFGTLDASSLHMVMNALDQLQNQGRKVVLISHIQEMHERIPVQIQVRPLGAGASTIEVVS